MKGQAYHIEELELYGERIKILVCNCSKPRDHIVIYLGFVH